MIGLSATDFRKGVLPGFKFVGHPEHKTRTLDALEYSSQGSDWPP
jgi:hypothetical protein